MTAPRHARPDREEERTALEIATDGLRRVRKGQRMIVDGRDVTGEVLVTIAKSILAAEPVRVGRRS